MAGVQVSVHTGGQTLPLFEMPQLDVSMRKVKLVLFALTPVLALGLVTHFTAAAVTHRHLSFDFDTLTGATTYRMQVGALPWSHKAESPLNSRGFLDEEYANLPPKGTCVHVVLAGDSFTFADVTDGEKGWVSLLRRSIAARHRGRCIRVFNVAAPVTTIEQQAKRVWETFDILKPDVVILGQYQNDLADLTNYGSIGYRPATSTTTTTNWGDRLRQSVPGFDSPAPRMLTYMAFKFFVEHNIRVDILRRWSVIADTTNVEYAKWLTGLYQQLYDPFVDELRRRKVGFAVVIMPSKFDLMAGRYPEGDYFGQLAKAKKVPALQLLPLLERHRDPMPYYTFDGHFNEIGNRLVAGEVYRWIFTSEENPVPMLREAAGPAIRPVPVTGFPK